MNLEVQRFAGTHDKIGGHSAEPLQVGGERTISRTKICKPKHAMLIGRGGRWLVGRVCACEHELGAGRVEPLAPGVGQCHRAGHVAVRSGSGGRWSGDNERGGYSSCDKGVLFLRMGNDIVIKNMLNMPGQQ